MHVKIFRILLTLGIDWKLCIHSEVFLVARGGLIANGPAKNLKKSKRVMIFRFFMTHVLVFKAFPNFCT